MKNTRTIGWVAVVGLASTPALGGCDLVAGIGEYCEVGVDPGCGTGGTAGSGGGGTGGTSPTGGGGSGGSSECSPGGAMQACYGGPDGTEGVGVCKGGMQTCQADGTWGPCDGEVVPGVETCASTDDEDCDSTECAIWSKVLGDAANQSVLDIAVDPSGNVIVLVAFQGEISIGAEVLSSKGADDLLLLKLDPAGSYLWARSFGDGAGQGNGSVAVDANGNIIIAGYFEGTLDFGCGAKSNTAAGTDDVFVAKLAPDGTCSWSQAFGDAQDQELYDVVVDELGDILVTGFHKGAINFGKGDLSAGSGSNVFVAKISSTGVTSWSNQYGDVSNQIGRRVDVRNDGRVLVGGSFSGTLNLGDGDHTDTTVGGADLFLAQLSTVDGSVIDSKVWPANAFLLLTGLTYDPTGNIVVSADFADVFDLDGVTYTSLGGNDTLVAEYSQLGTLLWSHQYGSSSPSEGSSRIATDKMGSVVLSMMSDGAVDLGGGALLSTGGNDLFVGKLSDTGQYLWGRRFGDAENQGFPRVATGPSGEIAFGSKISGTVDFGAGELVSSGDDIAIARLAP